jgi:WD40 repeat protein
MSTEPKELKDIVSEHQLFCARFSPCGTHLFAGSMDGGIRRWSLVYKSEAPPPPQPASATSETPAPTEKTAPPPAQKPAPPKTAAKPASPWELPSMPPLEGFQGWVQTLAVHPISTLVYGADTWGKVACFDYSVGPARTLWELPAAHDGWIRRIHVSPDGTLLASCGRDGFVRIWKSADGSPVAAFDAGADVFALAFSPDGTQVVFGDMFGKLGVLDLPSAKLARSLDGAVLHKLDRLQNVVGLRTLVFSRDGKTLVAGGLVPKNGGTVQGTPVLLYFDFASGQLQQQFTYGEPKDGHIEDIAIAPNGQSLAVASGVPGNGLLLFHNAGEKAAAFVSSKLPNCLSIALHPGGKQFVVTSTNKGSSGNGRRLTQEGDYPGNNSPIHLFELPS